VARGGIVWVDTTLFERLPRFPPALDDAVARMVDLFVPKSEAYMKQNAPWQDQTGNARATLNAKPDHGLVSHAIDVAHGMPYGIWLEVRFEGQYGIIPDTIKTVGLQLMTALSGLVVTF
jgi:hypothetical protein